MKLAIAGAGEHGIGMQCGVHAAQEAVADGRSAAAVMREIAPLVGGGGGGRDTMARAGGKDPSRLPEALARAEELLRGE